MNCPKCESKHRMVIVFFKYENEVIKQDGIRRLLCQDCGYQKEDMIENPETEWFKEPNWTKRVTGKIMDKLDLTFEIGQHPKINVYISISELIRNMAEWEVKNVIMYSELRLECLRK